jgi:uncharacterized membrane protein YciS (DUF1049 family)
MILGVFVILMALAIVFGGMLFGFMWLMDRVKAREERRHEGGAGPKTGP